MWDITWFRIDSFDSCSFFFLIFIIPFNDFRDAWLEKKREQKHEQTACVREVFFSRKMLKRLQSFKKFWVKPMYTSDIYVLN